MRQYTIEPRIDDICDLGKIVCVESCSNCEYCNKITNEYHTPFGIMTISNTTIIYCNYEKV